MAVSTQLTRVRLPGPGRDRANAYFKAPNLVRGRQNATDYTMFKPRTVATGTSGVTWSHHRKYTILRLSGRSSLTRLFTDKPRTTVTYDEDPANPTTDTLQRLIEVLLNSWPIAKGIIKRNTKPSGHGAFQPFILKRW